MFGESHNWEIPIRWLWTQILKQRCGLRKSTSLMCWVAAHGLGGLSHLFIWVCMKMGPNDNFNREDDKVMIIQWIWVFSHNFWRNPATESSSLAPPCYRQWHCIWVPPQMLAQGSGFLSIRSALGSFRSKQCHQREKIPLPKGKNSPRHFSLLLDLVILSLGECDQGRLEVKLPTIWRDGKAEVGRVREEKRRRKKIREEKESEDRRCRCAKR